MRCDFAPMRLDRLISDAMIENTGDDDGNNDGDDDGDDVGDDDGDDDGDDYGDDDDDDEMMEILQPVNDIAINNLRSSLI